MNCDKTGIQSEKQQGPWSASAENGQKHAKYGKTNLKSAHQKDNRNLKINRLSLGFFQFILQVNDKIAGSLFENRASLSAKQNIPVEPIPRIGTLPPYLFS